MKKRIKKLMAYILSAALIIPHGAMTAEAAAPSIDLYRDGRRLRDGDTVRESDLLYWKTEITLSDETESVDLPENLIYSGKKKITLQGPDGSNSLAELAEMADDNITIKNPEFIRKSNDEKPPSATPVEAAKRSRSAAPAKVSMANALKTATVSTASMAGKNTDNASDKSLPKTFRMSVPCLVDASKIDGAGLVSVGGIMLRVAKSGDMLDNITASLHKSEGGNPSKNPIKDGDTLGLNDDFILVIKRVDMSDIVAGIDYTIDLPDVIGAPKADGTGPLEISVGTEKRTFGNLSWTAGNQELKVRFINFSPIITSAGSIGLSDLANVEMKFNCNLDAGGLAADDQGRIAISLPGAAPFTVTISELVPKPPQLKKEAGNFDADGNVEWTVTYTHPVDAYKGEKPDKLEDALPEGMEYVTGSGVAEVTPASPGVSITLTDDPSARTLTCPVPGNLPSGSTLTVRYKTRITDEKIGQIWQAPDSSYRFSNRVTAQRADGSDIDPARTATASVTAPKNQPGFWPAVAKEGTVALNAGGQREIQWTVTVNTAGRSFQNLYVQDTMGKGLIFQPASLSINAGSIAPDYTAGSSSGKTELRVNLVKNAAPPAAEPVYTISYTTLVDQDYFDQTSGNIWTDADLSNAATVRYEWPAGSGAGIPPAPPTITKGPGDLGLNNQLIKKEAQNYNPADHSMKWKITVNPNKVDLTEAEIVDDISASTPEHTFTPGGKTEAEVRNEIENAVKTALSGTGVSYLVELNHDALKINLGALGKKEFSFTLTTYAKSPEFWASNSAARFSNTAVMKKAGTKVGGVEIASDFPASAVCAASSSVIKKDHTGYNADTKKILWKLTVNENGTNLGDVTVEDSLPAGLSVKPEDAAAAEIDGTAFGGDSRFFVGADGKLTVSLKNVTAKHEITFPATVDTDFEAFRLNQEVAFRNSARLQSGVNSSWVSSTESVAILENRVLGKSSNHPAGGTKVSYSVSLNPAGTDLLKGIAAGSSFYITDKLDDGLYLDLDSVKLFRADRTVKANGGKYSITLSKKAGGEETVPVSYHAKANSFSVEIPDSSGSYLLEYDAYVVRSGLDLSNHVSLEGSAIPAGSGNQDASASFYMSSFGGASFKLPEDKFFSMQIKKVDESGAKLSGAEFGLYKSRKESDLLVASGCDGSTGICTLAVPKSQIAGVDTLYWKERKAPAGYELNDEWKEVQVTPAPATVFHVTNVTSASAASGKVTILKTDKDSGSPLSGAEFRLYADQECLTPVGDSVKTRIDGTATFDHLYPTRNYWLKETAAPDGYVAQNAPVKVTADSGPSPSPYHVENERAKASVTITVTDAETTAIFLKGAKYQLYFDRSCLLPAGPPMETGADGRLTFSGLQPHFVYYMKMAAPAAGYELDAQVYTISTQENSIDIPVSTESNKIGWDAKAVLTLKKTNESGTEILEGAVFQLYRSDRLTLCGEQTTAENGECSFEKLREGTYYLKEIRAPEGYQLDDSWIPVQIDRNTDRSVTVKNRRSSPSWSGGTSSGGHVGDPSKGPGVPGPAFPDRPLVPDPVATPGDASDPLAGGARKTDQGDVMNAGVSKSKSLNKAGIPRTGVKSFAGLWALGAIASGLAMAACLVLFAKSRRQKNK